MTDDQHGEGTPESAGRWDPLPQGDYDDGATAFVQLPEGGIDALLAAPGHGYVPPQITVTPATTAGTDPAATGVWSIAGAAVDGTQWHDPNAGNTGDAEGQEAAQGGQFGYRPGETGQWEYAQNTGAVDGTYPEEAYPEGAYAEERAPHAAGHDVTGQWSIPVAEGDLPDESGEFTTSALVEQWGGTPPPTLPGGAAAPWATQPPEQAWGGAEQHQQHEQHDQYGHHEPYGRYEQPQSHEQYGGQGPQEHGQVPASDAELAYGHAPVPPAEPESVEAGYAEYAAAEQSPGPGAATAEEAGPEPVVPEPGSAEYVPLEQAARNAAVGHAPVAPAPGRPEPAPGRPAPESPAGAGPDVPSPDASVPSSPAPAPATAEAGDEQAEQDPVEAAPGPADASAELPVADVPEPAPEPVEEPTTAAASAATGPEAPAEPTPEGEAAADVEADAPEHPTPERHDEHPLASYVLSVNGSDRPVSDAWIGESLLYVLRERLGLAGAKDGCSQGECGACNVQVDGRLVASCLVPAVTAAGSEVRTVEGLATDGQPSDVQRALARCGAVQCGFCVPGMAMTVHDLLEGNPAPTELETRQALCGNLCRCSGYRGVVRAVQEVVAERAATGVADGREADADEARIPRQAGPGAGGVNATAFDGAEPPEPAGPHDQSYGRPHGDSHGQSHGQDGGHA